MKIVIALVSVLGCSLDAQITATLQRLPDSGQEIRVRNDFSVSLSAFVVAVSPVSRSANDSSAPLVHYFDTAGEPAGNPLLPGQERLILQNKSPRAFFQEPIVTAGILADGSTTGDVVLLSRLMLRRRSMLQAVETALETLTDAVRRNLPRDQLVEQFKKMADSVRRWYLPPEQQIGLSLYQAMIGKLMNLPEPKFGSPFPPSEFVERETATLRRQRVTLIESQPNLADTALVGNLTNRPN